MTSQEIANQLVELGYAKRAIVSHRFNVGTVISCDGGRFNLELWEAKLVINKLEKV